MITDTRIYSSIPQNEPSSPKLVSTKNCTLHHLSDVADMF